MIDKTADKILIFLKAPLKGFVKTRLAASLNDDAALLLYKAFVLDTVKKASGISEPLIFAYPEEKLSMVSDFLGCNLQVFPQKGHDLGEKMAEAFRSVFESGVKKAVLIGTDIPDLNEEILLKAFGKLNEYDCVFGPSKDGGYYLAGFSSKSFDGCFFKGIKWSTENVLSDTLLKIGEKGKTVYLLDTLNDIDTLNDLEEFVESKRERGIETSRVIDELIGKRVLK